jgi:hypothetical protein
MPLFDFGVDLGALRQRRPDLIRLSNRRHERGAIRFAFDVRGSACLSITHVRFAAKSGNVSETFLIPSDSAYRAISGRDINDNERSMALK